MSGKHEEFGLENGISISAGRHAAPLSTSFKQALSLLYKMGRYPMLGIVLMTVLRGLLPALQVSAVAGIVPDVANSNGESSRNSIFY